MFTVGYLKNSVRKKEYIYSSHTIQEVLLTNIRSREVYSMS